MIRLRLKMLKWYQPVSEQLSVDQRVDLVNYPPLYLDNVYNMHRTRAALAISNLPIDSLAARMIT